MPSGPRAIALSMSLMFGSVIPYHLLGGDDVAARKLGSALVCQREDRAAKLLRDKLMELVAVAAFVVVPRRLGEVVRSVVSNDVLDDGPQVVLDVVAEPAVR